MWFVLWTLALIVILIMSWVCGRKASNPDSMPMAGMGQVCLSFSWSSYEAYYLLFVHAWLAWVYAGAIAVVVLIPWVGLI
jgi:hypothetical protein